MTTIVPILSIDPAYYCSFIFAFDLPSNLVAKRYERWNKFLFLEKIIGRMVGNYLFGWFDKFPMSLFIERLNDCLNERWTFRCRDVVTKRTSFSWVKSCLLSVSLIKCMWLTYYGFDRGTRKRMTVSLGQVLRTTFSINYLNKWARSCSVNCIIFNLDW